MDALKFKAPNTYLIIFSILVLMAVLTWIVPPGHYERDTSKEKNPVIPGTFQYLEREGESAGNEQGIGAIFTAPIKGFVAVAHIIGFVLIVGGAFSVLQRTRAIDAGFNSVVRAHEKSRILRVLLIPSIMLLFSLGGATFGMSEEVIPFVLIFIPLFLSLGYDSITAVAVPYIGAHVGFAAAFLNPFTVGIAQGLAGLPLFSGIGVRLAVWGLFTTVAIVFVWLYSRRIIKNPERSSMYAEDKIRREKLLEEEKQAAEQMTLRHKLVLAVFLLGMAVLVWGVLQFGWYIDEISALFLGIGIVVAIVAGLTVDETTSAFIDGARDLVGTAIIIGLARGILIIAQDGQIIDTMLHFFSSLIGDWPAVLSAQAMVLVQTAINFFVPSGSGQAALTMPIMAPLSDLLGVTRQTAVLAYQFGDGFSNMIYPTAPVLLGTLSVAKVPWNKWALWILPLQIILLALSMVVIALVVMMQWQ